MKKNLESMPLMASKSDSDKLSGNLKAIDPETIVLSDECGDTMWDAVLAQYNSFSA